MTQVTVTSERIICTMSVMTTAMRTTVTERQEAFGTLALLYAKLGWSLPTGIEYASLPQMRASIELARESAAARGIEVA